jgi:hypothetical protein
VSSSEYRVVLPPQLTTAPGVTTTYTLTLIANGSVQDENGAKVPLPVQESFTIDLEPPRLVIDSVAAGTTGRVTEIRFRYEGQHSPFGPPGFELRRDGEEVQFVPWLTKTGDGYTARLWATEPRGRYGFTVRDNGIKDSAGNPPAGEHTISWVQRNRLTATIGPIEPALSADRPPDSIPITFNYPVTGFTIDDLQLSRGPHDGQSNAVGPVDLMTAPFQAQGSPYSVPARLEGSGASYRLVGVGAATVGVIGFQARGPLHGKYTLELPAEGSGIVDAYDLPLTADALGTFVIDRRHPLGVIEDLPAMTSKPVDTITVTFDEPVVGLGVEDFVLTKSLINPLWNPVALDLTGATVSSKCGGHGVDTQRTPVADERRRAALPLPGQPRLRGH